jgi:hypothetical protein
VIPAEFAEKTYEWPLYNQLERAQPFVYTPGQVMEKTVGFDAGMYVTNMVLWQTLGYSTPPPGTLLTGITWPAGWGPRNPKREFPDVRLNLFLQAKRPVYYERRPKTIKNLGGVGVPLWAFRVTKHQQKLLEVLSATTQGTAHVAYASAAFHTNAALFAHMKQGTIVENSTFPSVMALQDHEAWYYWSPGATGAANPNPENIEEAPLLGRIRTLAREGRRYEPGDLSWLDLTARNIIEAARSSEGALDAVGAHFFDDLQTLNRLADQVELGPSLRAYAQIGLFTTRFDLQWLVITGAA